jgi:hypothetical protein
LYWALQQYGRVPKDVAAKSVASLNQIRPYGSVGNLPWQENPGPPFGGSQAGNDLFAISESIRTYTEQQYEGTEQKIDQALESAGLVVFLGLPPAEKATARQDQAGKKSSSPAIEGSVASLRLDDDARK